MAAEGAITVVDSHTIVLKTNAPDITLIAGMADYPAAITHASTTPENLFTNQVNYGLSLNLDF